MACAVAVTSHRSKAIEQVRALGATNYQPDDEP